MSRAHIMGLLLFTAGLLLVGCGQAIATATKATGSRADAPTPNTADSTLPPATATASEQATVTAAPNVKETPEYYWSQLLHRDDIAPIYDPKFLPAEEAGYDDEDLVMGVEIGGETKAYHVGLLNFREMVNDELGGIPILVTW